MKTQSVLYTPYPKNPYAARGIVDLARRLLSNVHGTELRVGMAIPSTRSVVVSNGKVVKSTTWASPEDEASYFANPNLIQYVKEVLRGWKLEGDADGSQEAFINDILGPNPSGKTWVRDNLIPDSEVLWGGETITMWEW